MCRATTTTVSTTTNKTQSGNSSVSGGASNKKMPSSSSLSKKKKSKPAFDGAAFDKDGNCTKHKSVQLAEQVTQDGRVLWKEIKMVSSIDVSKYALAIKMCIRYDCNDRTYPNFIISLFYIIPVELSQMCSRASQITSCNLPRWCRQS